jgi:hypothetical protein
MKKGNWLMVLVVIGVCGIELLLFILLMGGSV